MIPSSVYSFVCPELSCYDMELTEFSPIRSHKCNKLLQDLPFYSPPSLPEEQKQSDFLDLCGQFHSDAYLTMLAHFSSSESMTGKKQRLIDQQILKDRLKPFNLEGQIFDGFLDFYRLIVSGTLRCVSLLEQRLVRVAINWYGGHTLAQKSRANSGAIINDAVLACLALLKHHEKVLFLNLDTCHAYGVEEAFFLSQKLVTCSFHSGLKSRTGTEADQSHNVINVPVQDPQDTACLFKAIVPRIVAELHPGAIVFVASPSFTTHFPACVHLVSQFQLPLLLLGGSNGGSGDDGLDGMDKTLMHEVKECAEATQGLFNETFVDNIPTQMSLQAEALKDRILSRFVSIL